MESVFKSRLIFNFIVILVCSLGVVSCNVSSGTQPIDLRINLVMPESFGNNYNGKLTVNLINDGKTVYQAETDENNSALFESIIPDLYDVSVSAEISSDDYSDITGETVQNGKYVLSGSYLRLVAASTSSVEVNMTVNRKQSLVISKIYYAGSKDLNNKNYLAGKYIEFFNNSDEEINIAGVYFGLIESESTPAYMIGDTPDYIYLKQIFRFPETGKTILQPGESVLVVNSATNHSESASREADLTNADFEAKYNKNKNNPDTPAIELVYSYIANTDMNLLQSGFSSVVIFETDEDVNSWEKVYKQGASKGSRYVKTPVKYITEGVECLKYDTEGIDVGNKRLYDYIDAGYTNIEAKSGYNGQVVYRKKITDETTGNVKLIDTNNSNNDFGLSDTILPGQFE